MSLPTYLANIKSSGIYRFVWDKSEIPNTDTEILRLVVGYSERGPFNTPVYIKSQTEFRSIFGGISKKLERQGCWFHRLALQALRKGPILCLNLKNFQDETVDAVKLGAPYPTNSFIDDSKTIDIALHDIYNTNRFWTLEPESLEEIEAVNPPGEDNYIVITATDSKETSNTIFIRGFEPTGYDVTFKEWYSSTLNGAEMPDYLNGYENNKLNRYWAEIYVFRGRFTPEIASSNVLCKYFDVDGTTVKLKPYIVNAFGEKKDTLDLLAANDASNFIRKYQGILLPEFQSATGSTLSLDILFNNDNQLHNMMMRLNSNLLYDRDINMDDINTMNWSVSGVMDNANTPKDSMTFNKLFSIDGNMPIIYNARLGVKTGEWMYSVVQLDGDIDKDKLAADFYSYNSTINNVPPTASDTDLTLTYTYTSNNGIAGATNTFTGKLESDGPDFTWIYSGVISPLAWAVAHSGVNAANDRLVKLTSRDTNNNLIEVYVKEADFNNVGTINLYDALGNEIDGEQLIDFAATASTTNLTFPEIFNKMGLTVGDTLIDIQDTVLTITDITVTDTTITIKFDKDPSQIVTGGFFKCAGSVAATSLNLVPTYLEGYDYSGSNPDSIPANTGVTDPQMRKNNWVDYQLGVLDLKGIRTGLTSKTDVDYRYLVDTFEAFAVPGECHAKLVLISKLKFNVLGLINFPNMKSFSKCKTMSFKDSNGFDSKYIAMGGNNMWPSSSQISGKFSLASEDNGASFVSYNTPVILKDPETGVKTAVPSAALVSNDFLDKFTKFLPYSIVAGPKRGRIQDPDLIGPEFSFSREDLDNLESMGVNCMVYVPGKGTYINSNQTAKQNPVSALSKIHIRELCTFLQDEIEKMMEYYHWDFNTPNLRQTLKDKADTICDTAYRNGGIYDYINVCDESNNTPEVIDNEMIILSTSIEPSRGAGKMVQELTLYRTGGLRAAIQDAQ